MEKSPIAQWLECSTGIWKVMGSTPVGAQKILFLHNSTWERFSIIYTLSKEPIHLSYLSLLSWIFNEHKKYNVTSSTW